MADVELVDHNADDASSTSVTEDPSASNCSVPIVDAPNPQQDVQSVESSTSAAQPLSKKAQKRLAKAAFFQEKKLERRKREKAAKKEKKRERRERAEVGEGDEDECVDGEPMKKKAKPSGPIRPFKARVVVDLGFDSYMSDKEIASLSSQLAYCYSANRRATCPFESIVFTSLEGRLRARLDSENNAGYSRWTNCEWWEEGYERLWSEDLPVEDKTSATERIPPSEDKEGKPLKPRSEKEAVVYLTADADNELEELKEGETYILGGIVDHNRYKYLCQKKATASGIRTARLPIGKYLAEMTTRKVLTVNQVFEILVRWAESRNWERAMHIVMPKRKFIQQPRKPQATIKSIVKLGEAEAIGEEEEAPNVGEIDESETEEEGGKT